MEKTQKTTAPTSMTFADAAEKVLRAEGKPLKYTELAKRAVAQGLVQTESQTSTAFRSARLLHSGRW